MFGRKPSGAGPLVRFGSSGEEPVRLGEPRRTEAPPPIRYGVAEVDISKGQMVRLELHADGFYKVTPYNDRQVPPCPPRN